jgi:hypothetical protein
MARAFIGNVPCQVLVDRDLGDSWAVTVLPPPGARVGDRELAPQVVKLQGEGRPQVAKGALEILQKAGRIDRFELDPAPPAEPAAAPKPAAEAAPQPAAAAPPAAPKPPAAG